jgi:hypothetical protein
LNAGRGSGADSMELRSGRLIEKNPFLAAAGWPKNRGLVR